MKIVSRMIFAQIMKSSLFVLLALVALFAFFDLIGQSGNIGTSYSMGQAFLLTALILPTRCYEVLPIAVMLGSIFTLSRLASTSQFTVLRVSGIGPWRFCGMLLMPGIVLVICAYLLGNLVAPPAQRLAKEFKLDISGSAFTGKELDSGIWVRDVQRNEAGEPKKISFVNVQRLRPGEAAVRKLCLVSTLLRISESRSGSSGCGLEACRSMRCRMWKSGMPQNVDWVSGR